MNVLPSSRALAAFALALPLAASAANEGTIVGRVTDASAHSVLSAVEVSLSGSDLRTTSNRSGEFVLHRVPPGQYTLTLSYLGLPSKTVLVTVEPNGTSRIDALLGDGEAVVMETLKVEDVRAGQARALNEQRARNNIANIISSDLTGQFPDKTIADAVKRLPGVTVETDTDTGGSEGRYITIRGMAASFNAVSINGVRVGIANADDSISRQVPLDVISAKSADTIIVTKSLRPDQDGDSIGGAVDIITRGALDSDGPTGFVEGAIGYRHILEGYSNYRYSNPNYEGAFSYSTPLGNSRRWGLQVAGNVRQVTSQKQRVSTLGWSDLSPDLSTYQPDGSALFLMDALALQDFFDHLTNTGASAAFEGRPSADHKFTITAAYNVRSTERGRQRQVIWFNDSFYPDDPADFDNYIVGTPSSSGDTVTSITTAENRVVREVREFHEDQSNLNLSLNGEARSGDLTWSYLAGFNRGQFKGDPDKDIWARFDSSFSSDNSYTITPGSVYFPSFSTSLDRNDPSEFMMRGIYLGTDVITDEEATFGTDAKLATELAGKPGFWKFGVKGRFRSRDRENTTLDYYRNRDWTIADFDGTSTVPSLVADYRADSIVKGRYDYGFYMDPARTRAAALTLIGSGDVEPFEDNEAMSQYYSYRAHERIAAAYAMGEFAVTPKLTVMGGIRAEATRIKFQNGLSDTATRDDSEGTEHNYNNALPSLHARYDFSKALSLRAAISSTIARPTFGDLNPRESIDDSGDVPVLQRGNITLKPIRSTNFDLSLDYYFSSVGYVSVGFFHKELKNSVFTPDGLTTVIDGDVYQLSEPRNTEGGRVTGVELAYDRELTFLPDVFRGLGVTTNWTHAESKVHTGLATNPTAPLFDQVKDTVNAGLFYERAGLRTRLSWLYRSGSTPADYGLDAVYAQRNRIFPASSALDFTVSYQFTPHWVVFAEVQNMLNSPGRAYNGDESLRLDYNEYTDWNAQIGIRWNL